MSDEVTFKIVKHIGVIAGYPGGWTKELNRISWNGGPAKLDIRDWSGDHRYFTGGNTLQDEEGKILSLLLRNELKGEEI